MAFGVMQSVKGVCATIITVGGVSMVCLMHLSMTSPTPGHPHTPGGDLTLPLVPTPGAVDISLTTEIYGTYFFSSVLSKFPY